MVLDAENGFPNFVIASDKGNKILVFSKHPFPRKSVFSGLLQDASGQRKQQHFLSVVQFVGFLPAKEVKKMNSG